MSHDPNLAHHFDTPEQQFETGKLGMWVFLATELLMFGGLFCAYAVYRHNHPEVFEYAHQYLNRWLGALNTIVLITSSLTMAWGVRAAQMGNKKLLMVMLALTLLGAAGFMVVKSIEYTSKWKEHIFIGGDNLFYKDAAETKNKAKVEELQTDVFQLKESEPQKIVTTPVTPLPADPNAGGADQAKIVPPNITPDGLAPQVKAASTHMLYEEMGMMDRHRVYTFFAIYFFMTGLHGLHVTIGIGLIFWILYRAAGPAERTWVLPAGLASLGVLVVVIALIAHATIALIIGGAITAAGIVWAVPRMMQKTTADGPGEFGPTYFTPVDLVGLYWHLVDLIWIFLFPLLYLIH
jgi:cytochrome c oxidase subunit 3